MAKGDAGKVKREPISKKVRFDVFKRDCFICQYCGKTPPLVILEIDHIHPVSKGGNNNADNLLTACFDCNRGKAAGLLTVSPQTVADKAIILAEKEEQLKQFDKLLKLKRKREDKQIDEIQNIFSSVFINREFTASFRESIRKSFIPFLNHQELLDSMAVSCQRMSKDEKAIKYFCGICWNKRRGE